jgi:hypothetical protein
MMLDAAPDLTRRFLDIVQGLTALGVGSLVAIVLGLRDRVKGIETTLLRFRTIDTRSEEHAVQIGQHEVRLDGHDREIDAIRRTPNYSPMRQSPERAR